MGAIQLSDEMQRAVEHAVAEGRAASVTAFVEAAVTRLIDDLAGEEDELTRIINVGIAQIESGDYVTYETAEDWRAHHEETMAWLDEQLANDP